MNHISQGKSIKAIKSNQSNQSSQPIKSCRYIKSIKIKGNKIKLTEFMMEADMASSLGDARRKIEQGGVSINSEKVLDYKTELNKKNDNGKIIKAGKLHFAKIIFK